MARITKFVKTIQNNWKKSVFGVAAITYGINYAREKYEINRLMRHYCAEALIYGDKTQPAHLQFPKVIVILNPSADKKSAPDTFEKYCAPILNLGGLSVDIVKTDSEGHARRYVEELEQLPQAILCAGGDGTLSEIVTGLFRRQNPNEVHPVIGVLPVGRENTFGEKLFNFTHATELNRAQGLADASLSIVRGNITPKDVMKVEVINEESQVVGKPVYALGGFEWSAYADAFNERDRYWYYGSWRNYVTFTFNAFSNTISWHCPATVTYTPPCSGCSNCYLAPNKVETKPANKRWWSGFIPSFRLGSSQTAANAPNYAKIQNPNCAVATSIECDSAGIIVHTSDTQNEPIPHLAFKLVKVQDGFSFIGSSWDRLNKNEINLDSELAIRTIEIQPRPNIIENSETERFFYIDHESYEIKPVRITLLPKLVNIYST